MPTIKDYTTGVLAELPNGTEVDFEVCLDEEGGIIYVNKDQRSDFKTFLCHKIKFTVSSDNYNTN